MGPADVQAFTRADPFQPFRIRLTDGRTFDFHQPYFSMPLPRYVLIGIPDPKSGGRWARDQVEVPWDQVACVERLPPQRSPLDFC